MAAMESAYKMGIDGVEFDVHHTSDDVAIILHDATLNRVSRSKQGKSCPLFSSISNLSYQQIKENCQLKNGEDIPTLDELLAYLGDKPIYKFIEFKDLPSENTLQSIKHYLEFNPEWVTFISFNKNALDRAYAKSSESPFWANANYLQIYKFIPKANGPYGVNLNHIFLSLITKKHFKHGVGVWTVDSVSRMKSVFKKSINFLTTNQPAICLALKNHLNGVGRQ